MEFISDRYYDHSKFANTRTIIQMHLEKFFANSVLKEEGSRIFYASKEWAFRQRLNLLNSNSSEAVSELQFPFCCYYRAGNWTVGPEVAPGVPAAELALFGTYEETPLLRFFNAQFPFTAVFFFNREDDAQLAYETITWLGLPSPNQDIVSGLEYKDHAIDIPVRFRIENIVFNPDYKEKDWLEKNKIIPIEVTCKLDSVIIMPKKQTPLSKMEPNDDIVTITHTALLDFLSFKQDKKDYYINEEGMLDEVAGTFIPDPELEGEFAVISTTPTSVTLAWDYNDDMSESYNTNVVIECSNGTSVTVPITDKTATITGLEPGSEYRFKIKFYALSGAINNYTVTTQTQANPDGSGGLDPAALIGITWTN